MGNKLYKSLRPKRLLNSIYSWLQGIPSVSHTEINKENIRKHIDKENPTILEIGCNDGTHSLWLHNIFKNPTIYCFEPDPRAISRFKKKVGHNPNIHLFEIALSDHDGEIEFHQSGGELTDEQLKEMPEGWDNKLTEGWDLSGSIRKPKEHLNLHPWVTFDKKILVTTSTLDNWCKKHNIDNIDFIWMDVQGAETDVFKGGKNTLPKTRFIYTEYNNQELYEGQLNLKQLMQHLKDFNIITRYPDDVLLRNKQL